MFDEKSDEGPVPDLRWLALLTPTIVKGISCYVGFFGEDSFKWKALTALEVICGMSCFVGVGICFGYRIARNKEKSVEAHWEKFHEILKVNHEQTCEEKKRTAAEKATLRTKLEQNERLIHHLENSLFEERNRNKRSAEEANKEALEALS